ncbi:hypothetical protein [Actinokineospora diospyrosa]|uniref:Uncharacterized protein n=1 Tax=Actinokineospora diospyrosa TaxID=103728 RepID=A0ABT1IIM3_9PSEU|nr:hypothetical protein [Actinokineospora diospyrosa]MCP2272495.1 hypothetical protein [Actinokineospora diospyrosa]
MQNPMYPELFGFTALTWQAGSTLITGGALAVAIAVGWRQLAAARKLREEQARPYIVVDIVPGLTSRKLLDLVVTNIGKSPAYDLRITFDPAPERTDEIGEFKLKDARILAEKTPMFAPGREFRMFFDSAVDRTKSQLPMSFAVKVEYKDSRGKGYIDETQLDFDVQRGAAYVAVYGIHDGVKALIDIAKKV